MSNHHKETNVMISTGGKCLTTTVVPRFRALCSVGLSVWLASASICPWNSTNATPNFNPETSTVVELSPRPRGKLLVDWFELGSSKFSPFPPPPEPTFTTPNATKSQSTLSLTTSMVKFKTADVSQITTGSESEETSDETSNDSSSEDEDSSSQEQTSPLSAVVRRVFTPFPMAQKLLQPSTTVVPTGDSKRLSSNLSQTTTTFQQRLYRGIVFPTQATLRVRPPQQHMAKPHVKNKDQSGRPRHISKPRNCAKGAACTAAASSSPSDFDMTRFADHPGALVKEFMNIRKGKSAGPPKRNKNPTRPQAKAKPVVTRQRQQSSVQPKYAFTPAGFGSLTKVAPNAPALMPTTKYPNATLGSNNVPKDTKEKVVQELFNMMVGYFVDNIDQIKRLKESAGNDSPTDEVNKDRASAALLSSSKVTAEVYGSESKLVPSAGSANAEGGAKLNQESGFYTYRSESAGQRNEAKRQIPSNPRRRNVHVEQHTDFRKMLLPSSIVPGVHRLPWQTSGFQQKSRRSFLTRQGSPEAKWPGNRFVKPQDFRMLATNRRELHDRKASLAPGITYYQQSLTRPFAGQSMSAEIDPTKFRLELPHQIEQNLRMLTKASGHEPLTKAINFTSFYPFNYNQNVAEQASGNILQPSARTPSELMSVLEQSFPRVENIPRSQHGPRYRRDLNMQIVQDPLKEQANKRQGPPEDLKDATTPSIIERILLSEDSSAMTNVGQIRKGDELSLTEETAADINICPDLARSAVGQMNKDGPVTENTKDIIAIYGKPGLERSQLISDKPHAVKRGAHGGTVGDHEAVFNTTVKDGSLTTASTMSSVLGMTTKAVLVGEAGINALRTDSSMTTRNYPFTLPFGRLKTLANSVSTTMASSTTANKASFINNTAKELQSSTAVRWLPSASSSSLPATLSTSTTGKITQSTSTPEPSSTQKMTTATSQRLTAPFTVTLLVRSSVQSTSSSTSQPISSEGTSRSTANLLQAKTTTSKESISETMYASTVAGITSRPPAVHITKPATEATVSNTASISFEEEPGSVPTTEKVDAPKTSKALKSQSSSEAGTSSAMVKHSQEDNNSKRTTKTEETTKLRTAVRLKAELPTSLPASSYSGKEGDDKPKNTLEAQQDSNWVDHRPKTRIVIIDYPYLTPQHAVQSASVSPAVASEESEGGQQEGASSQWLMKSTTSSFTSIEVTQPCEERSRRKKKKFGRRKTYKGSQQPDIITRGATRRITQQPAVDVPPELMAYLNDSPVVQEALKNITQSHGFNRSFPDVMESFLSRFTSVLDKYLKAMRQTFKDTHHQRAGYQEDERWTTPSYETVRILASSFLTSRLGEFITKRRELAMTGMLDKDMRKAQFEKDLKVNETSASVETTPVTGDNCREGGEGLREEVAEQGGGRSLTQAASRAKRQLDAFLPVIDFFNVDDFNKPLTSTTTKRPHVNARIKANNPFQKTHSGPLYHNVNRFQVNPGGLSSYGSAIEERRNSLGVGSVDGVRVESSYVVNRNAIGPKQRGYFRTRNRRNGLVIQLASPFHRYTQWPVFIPESHLQQ